MLIDLKIIYGFIGFGVLTLIGSVLLVRGLRGNIYDWLGHASASRWFFIGTGLALQLPLVLWVAFLIRQGWFDRWF